MPVKVGCCGFPVRMEKYFKGFKLVEIQQTFYHPPQIQTAVNWRTQAPPDFEFILKAWQLITHPPSSPTYKKAGIKIPPGEEKSYGFFAPTKQVFSAWEQMTQIAKALRARLILFQCPPSFHETEENCSNLKNFFSSISRDFIFIWEPRGKWKPETILKLCQELNLVHCVDPFQSQPLYGKIKYFRLHGGPSYRHKYTDQELLKLKEMIGEGESYILFNNLSMYEDALRFKLIISSQA